MDENADAKEAEDAKDVKKAEKDTSDIDDAKKTNMKNLIGQLVVFVILIVLTFWLIFKDQDIGELIGTFAHVNIIFVLIGLALMFGYFMTEAWNISTLLTGLGEKITIWQALKFTMIGFFFCAVTPGASGGQPLEIYYMTKEKISGPKATMAILIQTCGIQMAVMTLGIFFLLFSPPVPIEGPVLSLFSLGLLINGIALAVLLVCIFSNYLAQKVVDGFFTLMKKMNLKKIAAKQDAANASLQRYADSSNYIKKHQKEFWQAMGRSFIQMSLYYLIPYFVYLAFGLREFNAWQIFAMQSILFVATSGLPIPGAVGASESVFLSLYGAIFGLELVSSAMLTTRGINFYLWVIATMVVVIVNVARLNNKPSRKKKHEKKPKAAESQ